MSQLISSGVSGKRVAPKVPTRRRAPPPAPPPKPPAAKQSTPIAISDSEDAPTTIIPPTPPRTQPTPVVEEQHVSRVSGSAPGGDPTPPPPPPREPTPPPARQSNPVPVVRTTTEPAPTSSRSHVEQQLRHVSPAKATEPVVPPVDTPPVVPSQPLPIAATDVPTDTVDTGRQHATTTDAQPTAPSEKQTRKRKSNAAAAKPVPKRQKKSSTKSNETVQANVNADAPITPAESSGQDAIPGTSPPSVEGPPVIQQTAPEAVMTKTKVGRVKKPTSKAAPKAKATSRKKSTPKSAEVVVEDEDQEPPAQENPVDEEELPDAAAILTKKPKTKKPRKKKAAPAPPVEEPATGEDQGEILEEQEPQEAEDEEDEGSDPELHEIDANTVQMFDITRRTYKYGKTSDRERKMAEINWDEVKRKRLEEVVRIESGQQTGKEKDKQKGKDKEKEKGKEGETGEGVVETTEGGEEGQAAEGEGNQTSPPPPSEPEADQEPPAEGLRLRVVNGQIVEDETSLQINHPTATASDALDGVIEEENDLTLRLNRFTYLNDRRRAPTERVPQWRQKSDPWGEENTERFYEELARWGTDFQLLAAMFPGKSRRMVKMKFNREERADPGRIGDALLGRFEKRSIMPVLPSLTTPGLTDDSLAPPLQLQPTATTPGPPPPTLAPPIILPIPASIKPLRPQMSLTHYATASGRSLEEFTKYEGYEHAQREMREDFREREVAMQVALEEERELARQGRLAAEMKEKVVKEGEGRRKGKGSGGARGRGRKKGIGTLGGSG
ncbi:hypothetical protein LTR78_006464 [Recurvomyces mirabilis]|uniref:Myb-like domain-containing protein n=1 Tax=Recurvomyces mirabilis TaxID=574656 RepID=A0AAE0WKU6_9PEZI|nr:hypothetical protein LTR78_006464 [Recurvomyces mirabilis]KAK5151116.1 hypothetical protein LTS14_009612 [Recurvomyces mirabilis]